MPYPKRLIEVDLPIKRISAHARREKSIRHGHISTLHIWWARRPLAACRAVLCAALWPDPADDLCPRSFRETAARLMREFAFTAASERSVADLCDQATWGYLSALRQPEGALDPDDLNHMSVLRTVLLQFIADFANWDASTEPHYLETARALTQTAHEALGGLPGTRPLVVDPFAGGGAIPLEALRVGADAFASDLNPVAVLLNKVAIEYISRYGSRLADEVQKWGEWIKEQAENELSEFYPQDPDGAIPLAYLWARTIRCEGPGCGTEVPLLSGLWLAKTKSRSVALRMTPCDEGNGVDFEVNEDAKPKDVGEGTVRRGSATCPVCGYTTPVSRVREQLQTRRGGAADARLFAVVTTQMGKSGRFYRLPTDRDLEVVHRAQAELDRCSQEHKGALSLVPDELLDIRGIRHTWAMIYGIEQWGDVFTPRQALALTTFVRIVHKAREQLEKQYDRAAAVTIQTCLALTLNRQVDKLSSLTRYDTSRENPQGTFARQALPMVWDFNEVNPFSGSAGDWNTALDWVVRVLRQNVDDLAHNTGVGQTACTTATALVLPDDAANAYVTDPPYYDAVPYAYLSDFFYVWFKRTLGDAYPGLLLPVAVPKDEEIVVDRPHELSDSEKDVEFYERELTRAFAEGCRILRPDGIGTVVFASKTTASWEAILQSLVNAGWIITGSWPIDTEMASRVAAQGQARLASSIHLVCRPRENPDGSPRTDTIGEWRDVLNQLPPRIHAWMPRLAQEGVVGADAIFACLGPALEIYSRYSRVERADGTTVPLGDVIDEHRNVVERGYLSYVWEAVSREALSMIFEDADTAGFEADARLTAMWLWTLSSADGADANSNGKVIKSTGYTLEYDAARKIAQGLGAHLEKLSNLIEIKGDKARLLPTSERTQILFGKEGLSAPRGRKPVPMQMSLFEVETEEGVVGIGDMGTAPKGNTVLDRVHQAMLLFGSGRSEALRRFLVEEGAGQEARFWKLAQALSALYPAHTDEKRWVDGVLARKKGLGF